MDFFIKYNNKSFNQFKTIFCNHLNEIEPEINAIYVERLKHIDYIERANELSKQLAIGDVIESKNNVNDLSKSKGLFYLLNYIEKDRIMQICADEHGLLPIYYMEQESHIMISSSFLVLANNLINKTPNPDFYAELALLNTQLMGSTYYLSIKRLGYGEMIELKEGIKISSIHRMYNYFAASPLSLKSTINDIADKFIDITRHYVHEPCAISLTGGFDGRTITGCAHHYKADFINFSYGRKGNGDVDNPIYISQKLGLNYRLIELEQDYINANYIQSVESYLKYSGGLNGFQYPHSIHYARLIGAERNIIVTGYLGSEILANAKGADDEINSQCVLDFLKKMKLKNNYGYKLDSMLTELGIIYNSGNITNALEKLEAFFTSLPQHLTLNQKLAVFSFENIHRNTFGVWIYIAMHYAKVRVPFLDKDFLENISKTEVSQFYRRFLENNPVKRLNGQLLYPVILSKVWPELNAINSSKGYPPINILTSLGRLKIALNRYLKKNSFPEKHGLDKMSTISGVMSYIDKQGIRDYLQSEVDIEILLKRMNENTINRSYSFLALSKIEFARILNSL